jgi:hypothetical protein
MTNFILKTHKKDTVYAKPHLFILNKGMNSGKPLKQACPNCFVLIFENPEDNENFYHIAYSLWKIRFWHIHLCGSVIPFLKIPDFKREFFAKSTQLIKDHKEHQKNMAALKVLEQNETKLYKNIKLINELRQAIIYNYCNK